MMRTLAETGNGWMTFKDASNLKCNQTGETGNVVHLSNLCTEILEVTNQAETAVCNLGSINLGRMVRPGADGTAAFDFDRLGEVVRIAVPFLDRVVDINFYPTDEAGNSNAKWRPVGLGLMGLQDVFFQLGLPFDSDEARDLSTRISEEMYFHALWASTELAEVAGPHPGFAETRAAKGDLQFDLWGITPTDEARWAELRERIAAHGLRNSLLIAIAPTATIASIAGCYECIEPQVSNLFKRETLSGEFMQVNTYLVRELQARGLWTEPVIAAIKRTEGSIQDIDAIPDDVKLLYRTAWELPMRSLIDMAAARGAYIDQSQIAQPVHGVARPSGSSPPCTSTPGSRASRRRTTCGPARRRASTRPPGTSGAGTTTTPPTGGGEHGTVVRRLHRRGGRGLLAGEPRRRAKPASRPPHRHTHRHLQPPSAFDNHGDHAWPSSTPSASRSRSSHPRAPPLKATPRRTGALLDPGFNLTLRPMRYPQFYDMYRDAIRNTWTVEEIDFSDDVVDLHQKLLPAEKHMIHRLVAFFATGDSIVSNNLVLNLYQHINAPEARMYLSRQLYEEALHVQFYLTLLDSYIPDHDERTRGVRGASRTSRRSATRPSSASGGSSRSTSSTELRTREDRQNFLLNLICFAACIEGLFFFAAFAYVYFLRSKGLLNGLAAGTNWVFRDESCHMNFAFEVIDQIRNEEPDLFDDHLQSRVIEMITEAVECEYQFAADVLSEGVPGMSLTDTREYLQFVADTRLVTLGMPRVFGSKNPFGFMELQDVQELTNFFERKVAAYQVGVDGEVSFEEDF